MEHVPNCISNISYAIHDAHIQNVYPLNFLHFPLTRIFLWLLHKTCCHVGLRDCWLRLERIKLFSKEIRWSHKTLHPCASLIISSCLQHLQRSQRISIHESCASFIIHLTKLRHQIPIIMKIYTKKYKY